jgi:TIR domain
MARVAFFISYTKDDRVWAEWIAWQLEVAGYTTVLQAWDFRPGGDFVERMHQAVDEAERTIAVLSPVYLESAFGGVEWRSVFAKDPSGEKGLLVPVRVEECEPSGLLAGRIYLDLVGLDENAANQALLAGVKQGDRPGRPAVAPAFPGSATAGARAAPPPFPGPGPSISNLAPRNPHFTGRDDLLDRLAG